MREHRYDEVKALFSQWKFDPNGMQSLREAECFPTQIFRPFRTCGQGASACGSVSLVAAGHYTTLGMVSNLPWRRLLLLPSCSVYANGYLIAAKVYPSSSKERMRATGTLVPMITAMPLNMFGSELMYLLTV